MMTWLLTAVFLFPHVVKSAHFLQCKHECRSNKCHTEEDSRKKDERHYPVHDCTTCLICNFSLPYFTETESLGTIEISQTPDIRISTGYDEDIYIPFFTSHYLRAPPSCSSSCRSADTFGDYTVS
jgi:hypothetical protein